MNTKGYIDKDGTEGRKREICTRAIDKKNKYNSNF